MNKCKTVGCKNNVNKKDHYCNECRENTEKFVNELMKFRI